MASIAGGGDLPELIFGKTQIGAAQETEEPVPVVLDPRRRRGESCTHQGNYARSMLTEIEREKEEMEREIDAKSEFARSRYNVTGGGRR